MIQPTPTTQRLLASVICLAFFLPPVSRLTIAAATLRMDNNEQELLQAVQNGETERVRSLLQTKKKLAKAKDAEGSTALHFAARAGHYEIAQLLLMFDADAKAKTRTDVTPLHLAAQAGEVQIVNLLLSRKANVEAKDKSGRRPSDYAAAANNEDLASALRSKEEVQARQRRIRNTIIAIGIAAGAAIAIYYALNKDKDDEAKSKEEREKAAQEAAAQKAEIDKQEAEKRALQAEAEGLEREANKPINLPSSTRPANSPAIAATPKPEARPAISPITTAPSRSNASGQGSQRPYVVFVNGLDNCCAWGMNDLQNRLISQMNAEPRYVPYSSFDDQGKSGSVGTLKRGFTDTDPKALQDTDAPFLRDGAAFINNQLDRNRPLILIGHSFGGDSVLKLLPRINRRIQFVAVIDPVRTGGSRASLKELVVPNTVDYFHNRWQENKPFPNDFMADGTIPCQARKCDQDSQNIERRADFSPFSRACTDTEKFLRQCPDSGRVSLRVSHQGLPRDAYLQKQLGDKIQYVLSLATISVPNRYEAAMLHHNNKAYFFAGGKYYRFDFDFDRFDKVGTIGVDGWKGVPANVGAALLHPNGKAHFFVGDKYYRFNSQSDQVDKVGTIGVDGWRGLPPNIRAAMMHPNGKAYFFAGDKYYRFDFQADKVDRVGTIGAEGWRGLPANIEAATGHPNGKAYFFAGDKYYRFDFQSDRVDKVGTIGVDGWKGQ